MVKAGQAIVYCQYLDACAGTEDKYLQAAQAEAQKYLLPGDPYKLDGAGNKDACESLP